MPNEPKAENNRSTVISTEANSNIQIPFSSNDFSLQPHDFEQVDALSNNISYQQSVLQVARATMRMKADKAT
jgi:hypothetical protein